MTASVLRLKREREREGGRVTPFDAEKLHDLPLFPPLQWFLLWQSSNWGSPRGAALSDTLLAC